MESIDTKIVVTLIAVFVSFVSLIITKENKTSEFRQKWIDTIRDDIAKLMGSLNQYIVIYIAENPITQEEKTEYLKRNIQNLNEISTLIHSIKLKLNPEKDDDLLMILYHIERFIGDPTKLEISEYDELVGTLAMKSHFLLKQEWTRVKKGEPIFNFFKYIFGITILLSTIYTFVMMYNNFDISNTSQHNKVQEKNKLP